MAWWALESTIVNFYRISRKKFINRKLKQTIIFRKNFVRKLKWK